MTTIMGRAQDISNLLKSTRIEHKESTESVYHLGGSVQLGVKFIHLFLDCTHLVLSISQHIHQYQKAPQGGCGHRRQHARLC